MMIRAMPVLLPKINNKAMPVPPIQETLVLSSISFKKTIFRDALYIV